MEYDKLVPAITPDTQPYWDGLRQRKLVLQRCAACQKVRHYPRPVCDACWSMEVEWIEASGRGTVHSWTVSYYAFHPAYKAEMPYLLLTVDLPEGVRMNAQAREMQVDSVSVGMPVRVDFEAATETLTLPVFKPG